VSAVRSTTPRRARLPVERINTRKIAARSFFCELDCSDIVLYEVDPNVPVRPPIEHEKHDAHAGAALHPAWLEFMRFCRQMRHGEIDQLRIQDGLPLLAQTVRKKVKFTK
jgi:hypothetical protein